ncbi:MAG: hypothetical protein U1F83_18215 [Verrucomicrobiota bacterium]
MPIGQSRRAWRYHKGTNAPTADWKTTPDVALDATWLTGNGGFGYADNAPETANAQTILSDMSGVYTTLYTRSQFSITNTVTPAEHFVSASGLG